MNQQLEIKNEAEMIVWGQRFSTILAEMVNGKAPTDSASTVDDKTANLRKRICVVYLNGDLGAGKTTLVKGLLLGLDYSGVVTSPTYTLMETYAPRGFPIYHFDLYRLKQASELEYLGIRDLMVAPALILVEWPEKGCGVIPEADIVIQIDHIDDTRRLSVPSFLIQ